MPFRWVREHCMVEVNWLHANDAAAFAGISRHTVYRWMREGLVHVWDQPNGRRLVCERSLRGQQGMRRHAIEEKKRDEGRRDA
jgi:predicted site-specific integrase-resolvase